MSPPTPHIACGAAGPTSLARPPAPPDGLVLAPPATGVADVPVVGVAVAFAVTFAVAVADADAIAVPSPSKEAEYELND